MGLLPVVIDIKEDGACDGGGDQHSLANNWLKNGREGTKLLLGMATSLVATRRRLKPRRGFEGGLKSSVWQGEAI